MLSQKPTHAIEYMTAIGCFVLSAALTAGVMFQTTTAADLTMRTEIHQWASPTLTLVAGSLSFLGSVAVIMTLAVITAASLLYVSRGRACLLLTIVMLGAVALNNGLKNMVQRPRPVPFFGTNPESYSFPSGHALYATCFFGILAIIFAGRSRSSYCRAAAWAGAIVLIMGIGFSRVYLGVHYPTDVLAGYLVGTCWICVSKISLRTATDLAAK